MFHWKIALRYFNKKKKNYKVNKKLNVFMDELFTVRSIICSWKREVNFHFMPALKM